MASFGHELRRTREQRGVSLEDIARETRLSKRYLLALEDEAIAKLPGGAYNRAYLKIYASTLGLDPEPLLRQYADEEARHAQSELDQLAAMNRAIERRGAILIGQASSWSDESKASRLISLVAVSLASVAVVTGAAWFGWSGFRGAASVVELAGEAPPADVAMTTSSRPTPSSSSSSSSTDGVARLPLADAVPASYRRSLSHLALAGSGVGTSIVDRQLVGEAKRFAAGSRVVFWTHVRGGRTSDTIDHVWFRDGILVGAASLAIGSDDWRTQSRRRLDSPGVWAVEARDPAGHVLARHEFQIRD